MSDDTELNQPAETDSDDLDSTVETQYGAVMSLSRDQIVVHPTVDEWLDVATAARADGYDQLTDLTAVDYLTYGGRRTVPSGVDAERYEVVAHLLSLGRRRRLRMRVQVSESAPTVPTLFDVWPGAEAMEREVFDMFGITFSDHPDHSRILMPEDWDGHPLRKDYAIGDIPVQFKAASNVR